VGEFLYPYPRLALPYFNGTWLDFTGGHRSKSPPAFELYIDRSDAVALLSVFDAMFWQVSRHPIIGPPSKRCFQ
jgi:hypothetical protein